MAGEDEKEKRQRQELPKIFGPYYRTREVHSGSVRDLGLGLYIAKSLVDTHGGRIWVESTPGETTTFHVMLPWVPALSAAG